MKAAIFYLPVLKIAGKKIRAWPATFKVGGQINIRVALQERSEHDPYVSIVAAAEADTINIVINRLHPYYESLETSEAIDECIRQYIFDAIAEYKVHKQQSNVNPEIT